MLVQMACTRSGAAPPPRSPLPPDGDRLWVCAYYLSGDQDTGRLPPQQIDCTAFSHLIHFGIIPNGDGTIGPVKGAITPEQSRTVVARVHAAGRKALVCVGTDEGAVHLRQALTAPVRPTLIRNLVDFVVTRGYDGLDIDMEPIADSDVAHYESFIAELRAQLTAANPKLLLTAAVASQPAMFARLQSKFDRIDLMTYDLAGPFPGNDTWYNAPLFDGGKRQLSDGQPYPSVESMVRQFVQAGVSRAKLGIGIAFYGYVWTGATGPQQSIKGVKVDDGVDYHTIMDQYYRPDRYHWDDAAQAPYLSLDGPMPADRKFISYDDARLCTLKVAYARRQGLGGLIIWELGGGYRASQPAAQRDALLQAVKRAWFGTNRQVGAKARRSPPRVRKRM
jgi:chitinase